MDQDRMDIRYSVMACILLLFALVNASSLVYSTPPSREAIFVNRDELTRISQGFFGVDVSTYVQERINQSIDSRPSLVSPYGPAFLAVDGYYVVTEIFLKIGNKKIEHGKEKRFKDFLKAINKRPVVRGAMSTPDYSGCLLIRISLEEKHERLYLISQQSAHQFKGCWPTNGRRYEISSQTLFE